MRASSAGLAALLLLLCLSGCGKPALREAEADLRAGRYREAERALSQMIEQGGAPREAAPLLAQARFYTDGPEAAIAQLAQVHAEQQDDKVYRQVVASLSEEYARLDKLARGGKDADLESYLREDHPVALEARVRWLQASRKGAGFPGLADSDEPLVRQLARWRQAGDDPGRLATLLKDFPESRLRPAWYKALSDRLWQDERKAEAIEVMQRWEKELPERHPRRATLLLARADRAIEADRPALALQDYHSYLKSFPKHPAGREAIYAMRTKLQPWLRGSDHRFLAEQAHAREMYQTAYAELSHLPAGSAATIYRLGEYALEGRLNTEARSHFERVSTNYRGSREAGLAAVGLASLRRQAKAYGEALKLLGDVRQAYRSQPAVLAAALYEEGIVHDFQNRDDLRSRAYHQLLAADPGFKEAPTALWYAIWYDYRQGNYRRVLETLSKHRRAFAGHELYSRFVYWEARCHEALKDRDAALALYRELRDRPLMDYYAHRARERLRVIEHGGEDRYATAPYEGFTRERVPDPGYATAFRQAIAGDKEAFSEAIELYYLRHPGFAGLAPDEAAPVFQVLHAKQMHSEGRHYEAITRYRYPAETNDAYLTAAYPLAFFEHVEKEARANGLNPFLVSGQIWQESQYKPDIKSWVGATGLMQIMPATGAGIAQNLDIKNYNLTDPATNIRMGTWYLKSRHDVFDGNPLFAVASYNAGAGPVMRWREQFGHLPYDAQAESIPYPETRGYVKRVFTSYWIYQALYGK